MKFKGIAGGRHPSLKKGDVIQLSAEEKVIAMAKEQISENSPEGVRRIPISAEILGEVQTISGRRDIKKPEPTQYISTLVIKYRVLKLSTDRIMPAKKVKVKVHCKDCHNDIGVPDLQVVDFKELKEL